MSTNNSRNNDFCFYPLSPSPCCAGGSIPPPLACSPHLQPEKFHLVNDNKSDLFVPTLLDGDDACGLLIDEEMNLSLSPRQSSDSGNVVSVETQDDLVLMDNLLGNGSMPPSIILDNDTFSISDHESMGGFPEFPELDDCITEKTEEYFGDVPSRTSGDHDCGNKL